MESQPVPGKLLQINPFDIEPNDDNPRILFDPEELKYLQQSIAKNGILVPLIVYRKPKSKTKFVLLDGERRLRCAQNLKLKQVPANEIVQPNKVHNILLMFNIHNVREDWELVPKALKLEVLMRLLPEGENTPNQELAKLTSMSSIRITECKRILKYDRKYINMAVDLDPTKRVSGDFLSQLEAALEKLKDYPEITKEYSRNKIIDTMIKKYREGTIVNIIQEFRKLRKILDSKKKGIEKKLIIENVKKYIESNPVLDRGGKTISKAMTMDELFEKTSYTVYKESEIVKKANDLEISLQKFDITKAKDVKTLITALKKLSDRINKVLKNA